MERDDIMKSENNVANMFKFLVSGDDVDITEELDDDILIINIEFSCIKIINTLLFAELIKKYDISTCVYSKNNNKITMSMSCYNMGE